MVQYIEKVIPLSFVILKNSSKEIKVFAVRYKIKTYGQFDYPKANF